MRLHTEPVRAPRTRADIIAEALAIEAEPEPRMVVPRVTQADLDAVDDAMREVGELHERAEARRRRWGLRTYGSRG